MTTTSEVDLSLLPLMLPFDPFDPAFHADPYATYRALRAEHGPVIRTVGGVVFAIGFDEVSRLLRDPRLGWGDGEAVADQFFENPDGPPSRPMIFLDPPDHTRIRSLISKAFSSRMVEGMRSRAEVMMAELIASARAAGRHGPVDVMSAVAGQLPAMLVGSLLGVSPDRFDEFSGWAAASGRGLDPSFVLTAAQVSARDEARAAMMEYFGQLAAQRRSEPRDDLVTELVNVEQDGDRLTELELTATCMGLLGAGYGTTVNLIGSGLLALLRHPDQLAWFRANPDQAPGVVEELIRYDSPIQLTSRIALEDLEIGGHEVVEEQQIFLMIGGANRDPVAYERPDELDVTRRGTRNLGFGLGIHYCIGAPLARLGSQVALTALAQADIRLTENPPVYRDSLVLRALDQLLVTIR